MDKPLDGWLATVLKSIADGVIATDADARVVFMNAAAEQLTGWPQSEAAGRDIADVFQLIDERTGKQEVWPVRQALESRQPVRIPETTVLVSRSGVRLGINDIASPVWDREGNLTGIVLVFRDVTTRRLAEDE